MTTGTDTLRAALRARSRNLAGFARDLQVGIGGLQEFATGNGRLPVPIMQRLTVIIFGSNAAFDAEADLLVRTPESPKPVPLSHPPPLPHREPVKYTVSPGPQPVPQPRLTKEHPGKHGRFVRVPEPVPSHKWPRLPGWKQGA